MTDPRHAVPASGESAHFPVPRDDTDVPSSSPLIQEAVEALLRSGKQAATVHAIERTVGPGIAGTVVTQQLKLVTLRIRLE